MFSAVGVFWAAALMASEQPSTASDGNLMYKHWQCAAWSAMNSEWDAAEIHQELGLSAGRRFLEFYTDTPGSDYSWVLDVEPEVVSAVEAPSADFLRLRLPDMVLGRIYERATASAFEATRTLDLTSGTSDQDGGIENRRRGVSAAVLIRTHNCSLLRS